MSVLAVDLGATRVRARLDAGGGVPAERTWLLPDLGNGWEEAAVVVEDILGLLAGHAGELQAAAFAVAPNVTATGRVLTWPNRPHWEGVEFGGLLRGALGMECVLEDDGNAAAFYESELRNVPDLALVMIGTGVGGGIVLNGQLVRGGGHAGEFGHLPLGPTGTRCRCGRTGCVQAVASARGILTEAAAHRGSGVPVSPEELRSAVEAAWPWAIESLHQAVEALAKLVLTVGELLDIPMVALAGPVVDSFPLVRLVSRELIHLAAGRTRPVVVEALSGANAPLEGANRLAWRAVASAERFPATHLSEVLS